MTISALVLWQTPWTDLTKGLQTAYHAGIEYQQNEDVEQKAAQERIDAVAKSKGPEAADALREDLRRQKGEALRHERQATRRAVRPGRHGRRHAKSVDDGQSGQPGGA